METERFDAGRILSASPNQGRQLRVVEVAVAGPSARLANAPRRSAEAIRQGIEATGRVGKAGRAGKAARMGCEVVRAGLLEKIELGTEVRFFRWEQHPMYTKRESEVIQQHLTQYGELPSGSDDELDDLF